MGPLASQEAKPLCKMTLMRLIILVAALLCVVAGFGEPSGYDDYDNHPDAPDYVARSYNCCGTCYLNDGREIKHDETAVVTVRSSWRGSMNYLCTCVAPFDDDYDSKCHYTAL